MYINAGGGWEQRGSDLDGSAAGDWFGFSVSLSADGTILAVGATYADGVNGVNSGRVYVFQWISNAWQPLGSTLDGAGAYDDFGFSVALSDDGTILAVGARDNGAGGSNAGHVRVFAWADTDWTQRGNDLLGSSREDQFGNSVSLSSDGSILACGGDQPGNDGPGYVGVYHWSGSAWQQQGSTLMGFSSNDDFGESVSLREMGASLLLVQTMAFMLLCTEMTGPIGCRSAKPFVVNLVITLDSQCRCPLMAKQSSLAGTRMIPTAATLVMPLSSGYHQTNKNGGR